MEKVFEIYIKTTPERLWAAIIDPEVRSKYNFGVAIMSDFTPGSRYEAAMTVSGLNAGGFDAQSLYTVPAAKLMRRRAILNLGQLKQVEEKVKLWLGLA